MDSLLKILILQKCVKKVVLNLLVQVSDTIKKMGDKITAKTLAEDSGIQIVPGYKDDIPEDPDEFKKIAKNIGYPIMIKATAGGGGRGMRVVESEDDLIIKRRNNNARSKKCFW
jgi:acetyl/propionyl-CoA carboxylase alpha subunit